MIILSSLQVLHLCEWFNCMVTSPPSFLQFYGIATPSFIYLQGLHDDDTKTQRDCRGAAVLGNALDNIRHQSSAAEDGCLACGSNHTIIKTSLMQSPAVEDGWLTSSLISTHTGTRPSSMQAPAAEVRWLMSSLSSNHTSTSSMQLPAAEDGWVRSSHSRNHTSNSSMQSSTAEG